MSQRGGRQDVHGDVRPPMNVVTNWPRTHGIRAIGSIRASRAQPIGTRSDWKTGVMKREHHV